MLRNLRDVMLDIYTCIWVSRQSGFVTSFAITDNDGRSALSSGGRNIGNWLAAVPYAEGVLTYRHSAGRRVLQIAQRFQTENF